MEHEEIKKAVRERYGNIAATGTSCGCSPQPTVQSCCGPETSADTFSKKIGYTADDLSAVPDGANMGLGCGNPVALASLKEGEVVLDLGSGGGSGLLSGGTKSRREGPRHRGRYDRRDAG